ncbi:hypothetical protein FOCC_FOCC007020 [Frankliniella occidentalis]|nr:hypothetical protein FOCC_FOCC007020 [Frankliniella occidentalis]
MTPREPRCDSPGYPRVAPWAGRPGPPDAHGYPADDPARYQGELGELDAQGDQYIYVTYPPDLKRRLLERPAQQPPTPSLSPALHHHHAHHYQHQHLQQQHHQPSQPVMAPHLGGHHLHHHHQQHYPMHGSPSPSPHLSHLSQMSHMQHLAQMPRGSPMGAHMQPSPMSSTPKQQEPNPYEREWRI